MKRKNRKSPKRRKAQRRKHTRLARAKRGVRNQRAGQRRSVRSSGPTDPRVARALGLMRREGLSASKAARHEGLKLDTFVRQARPALRRSAPGKPWRAIPEDQLPAAMKVLTKFGYTTDIVRSSRERRLLGAYSRTIRMFRAGEDGAELALKSFRRKTVAGHTLITDIKILIRLEEAGKLDFDDLYSPFGDES